MRITIVLLTLATILGCSQPAERPGEPDTAQGASLDVGAAQFDLPEGWTARQPSSSMRLAEAEIPGEAGPAILTVFFFGPGGGGEVEANIQRWIGQVELDPGSEAVRDTFSIDGYTVHTVTAAGTLKPSTMGTGPSEPVPDSMLLGAVVEGEGGPWFFKITGPASTVIPAGPAFDRMLRSVRPS